MMILLDLGPPSHGPGTNYLVCAVRHQVAGRRRVKVEANNPVLAVWWACC